MTVNFMTARPNGETKPNDWLNVANSNQEFPTEIMGVEYHAHKIKPADLPAVRDRLNSFNLSEFTRKHVDWHDRFKQYHSALVEMVDHAIANNLEVYWG